MCKLAKNFFRAWPEIKNRVDKGNNNSNNSKTTKGRKANPPGIHISNNKKEHMYVCGGGTGERSVSRACMRVCVCAGTKIHKTERNTQKICRNTWSKSSKDYFQVGSRLSGQRLQAEATDGQRHRAQ